MDELRKTGRVTIPTDLDVVPETLEILKKWGADAIRDCDGTDFPQQLKDADAKIYSTYYTTRKDNAWAKANPDEVQQCYIMTGYYTAPGDTVAIPATHLLTRKDVVYRCNIAGVKAIVAAGEPVITGHIAAAMPESPTTKLLISDGPEVPEGFLDFHEGIRHAAPFVRPQHVNTNDDITRWWEVMDRTTGQPVPPEQWSYADGSVTVQAEPYHEFPQIYLSYLIWDPVHMYNATTNGWTNFEHQITFDVRQPKTHKYSMERLRKFIAEHPYVNVIRYTTFFHQFTLIFDELKREKFVDWYGYSASVSPYILNQFEQEVGYKFRPEYIIDQGYYNNQYRVPSKEFRDFQAFQRREVAKLAKEMVDITHACGCEAMMFLGDHWIGTEPFMPEFKTIGLDAIVGSVGNGSTLRLISDIEGVKYTEGRFLPYFFPDTFHEGGDPVREAKENWVTARRAILRKPIDRIGYGGYLKLALQFPEFVDYVESVCNEFRELYENIKGTTPYCVKRVAVLNCWGKMRAWGCHMVHHALYYKQNYSYAGVIEMLSGAPFDVKFISFEDIKNDPHLLDSLDVIINVGDADTAHTGGIWWEDPEISSAIRKFVWNGGGFIGVCEPSGHPYQGHILQLASVLGVEEENGFTLNYDKYNWEEHPDHFILQDADQPVDFGEGKKNIYALEGTEVLVQRNKEVQMAAHDFGKGRAVYISGVPYSFANSRTLYRAILWSAHSEEELHTWFSSNYNVEVHAYVKNGKYCVVNNTYEPQDTTVYTTDGSSFALHLDANEIKWYEI